MADHGKVAEFNISLVFGNDSDITQFLTGLKTKFAGAVNELEKISNQADLFSTLQAKVASLQTALDANSRAARDFKAQIDAITASGGKVTDELNKSLALTNAENNKLTQQLATTVTSLGKVSASLKTAGFDTNAFAASQTKLTAAIKETSDALAVQSAKGALGLKTFADIQPQIASLNTAFNTLKDSGKLSANEIAAAQDLLQAKIKTLTAEVNTNAQSFVQAAGGAKSFLTENLNAILGVVGGAAALTAAYHAVVDAATEYRQRQAEIATVTNLSKDQITALTQGVRELSTELGIDAQDALKGLYELLRSGVPSENSLEVLRISAEAAKGAIASTADGVKAANILISGLGVPVNQLGAAFDVLARAQHDGGATLAEFAAQAGPLANVARAAGVSVEELSAVLTVMTNASGDASGSISSLQKLIVKLGDPEVIEKLHGLGIETGSLVTTLQQLGDKGLALNQVLDLGVASTKSAASIAALTNNSGALTAELTRMSTAAGEAKANLDKISDTPKEKFDKLKSAVADFTTTMGEQVVKNQTLIGGLTELLNLYNKLPDSVKQVDGSAKSLAIALVGLVGSLVGAGPATAAVAKAQGDLGQAAAQTQKNIEALSIAIGKQGQELSAAAARLAADGKVIQEQTNQQLADIDARATAEIAALDRSKKATLDTATATLQIQNDAAAKKLAVIQKNESDIESTVTLSIAAQQKASRAQGVDEAAIVAASAKARIDAIGQTLGEYTKLYNSLVAQEQGYAAQSRQIEAGRLAFNEGIEKTLFDLRISTLDSFDQYVAKSQEADRLVSLSRQAAAIGDTQNAEKYGKEAIAIAGQLGDSYTLNGVKIDKTSDSQAAKLRIVKTVADSVNTAYESAGAAAKEGADDTKEQIDSVKKKIDELQDRYDAWKEVAAAGVDLKVAIDEASFAAANKALADLTATRTAIVNVQYNDGGAGFVGPPAPQSGGATGSFNRGGHVPQRFAAGGSIFRPLSGSKVPGVGNEDTHPAMLKLGSFVMKKAAAQHYGDGIMGSLVRRYADGGSVYDPTKNSGYGYGTVNTNSTFDSKKVSEGDAQNKILHDLKVQAEQEFGKIFSDMSGLPNSTTGQDAGEYVSRVLAIIESSMDAVAIQGFLDSILSPSGYNRFEPAIQASKLWHVPLVMGSSGTGQDPNAKGTNNAPAVPGNSSAKAPLAGTADSLYSPPSGWQRLQDATSAWERLNPGLAGVFGGWGGGNSTGLTGVGGWSSDITQGGGGYGGGSDGGGSSFGDGTPYAGGGGVDSIRALLTPGEHVLNPPAVQFTARMFGGGFLDAVNNMQVPKNFLSNMMDIAPPRRYANGGYVNGENGQPVPLNGSPSPDTGKAKFAGTVNLNFYSQKMDADEVRRTVLPELNKIIMSSR